MMGWENRNGRLYYYRKRKVGGRVISEYVGIDGGIQAILAEEDLRTEQEARQMEREEIAGMKAADREVYGTLDMLARLADGLLLTAGYRRHKGCWRKPHGRKQKPGAGRDPQES